MLIEQPSETCKWKHVHFFYVLRPTHVFAWGPLSALSTTILLHKYISGICLSLSWWSPPRRYSQTVYSHLSNPRKIEYACKHNFSTFCTLRLLLPSTLPPHPPKKKNLFVDSEKKNPGFRNQVHLKLLRISYVVHKTNDWVRSEINILVRQPEPLLATGKRRKLCMLRACHTPRQFLQNHPSGHLWGWATPWSAEETLNRQHQRVDIPAHDRTANNGLLQKRLKEDLCWIVPHVPPTTQSGKGQKWTELPQRWHQLIKCYDTRHVKLEEGAGENDVEWTEKAETKRRNSWRSMQSNFPTKSKVLRRGSLIVLDTLLRGS